MHFYDFNIGDFAKKTQHLTNEEELAYRRALDMYYDTENPLLSGGLATLSRRLRVDQKSLQNVLDEFFPDGKNKHADEKIAEYHEYLAKQKANGRKGGRRKVDIKEPTANPPLTQKNPVLSQPLTTKPLTNDISNTNVLLVSNDVANCPHDEIIKLYAKHLPMLSQVKIWSEARAKHLKARWREDLKRQKLDYWERFFAYVGQSDFLTGRNGQWLNCDLAWLVKSENFIKVLEGKYQNKEAGNG